MDVTVFGYNDTEVVVCCLFFNVDSAAKCANSLMDAVNINFIRVVDEINQQTTEWTKTSLGNWRCNLSYIDSLVQAVMQ